MILSSFAYHDKFSEAMGIVLPEIVNRLRMKKEVANILDIPAGAGRLSDKLRGEGLNVVSADINAAKSDYVFADMNETLPFDNEQFDAVVSMEGIEHIINYQGFISELSRVTKKGGFLILTTPNISCFYSRLMFMCTGNFFQFWPSQGYVNVGGKEIFDYGHITPLTWQKIYFHFTHYGFALAALRGNKIKRKILLPLYIPLMMIGFPWIAFRLRYTRKGIKHLLSQTDYYQTVEKFSYSLPAMFSRNIIMILEKGK